MKSNIITISGTSAAGKSFLVDRIIKRYPCFLEIAGVTTRPKREGEIEGQSSHFLTLDEFNQLEKMGKFMLVKEFFGNKYAWFKSDLTNKEGLRIMNISYKSIEELKKSLNVFSIFVQPQSEEKIKEMLQLRNLSQKEYQKRLQDYNESMEFISKSKDIFDLLIINDYTENTVENLLRYIGESFSIQDHSTQSSLTTEIEGLLALDTSLDRRIEVADEILKYTELGDKKIEDERE